MAERFGENEQPRHGAISIGAQPVANHLHAFRRPQIDVHHDTCEIVTGSERNLRCRDGRDLAHRLQNAGEFAAAIAAVGRKQQTAFGRSLFG